MSGQASLVETQIVTEPLGGSALSLAVQEGSVPAEWYLDRPRSVATWRKRIEAIAASFAGGEWASALAPALQASGAAADRLDRVVTANGAVMTTGQQPGLFGGPVYTFSKAITALALADELEAQTGVPVAPVFWAATDDADFEEARWTKVATSGGVEHLEIHESPPVRTPMSAAAVGNVSAALNALERASGSSSFPDALEAARAAYRPEATIGAAYVALLRALLEPLGIAILDASHVAVRRCGADVLRRALARAPEISAALRARDVELREAGFEPQVADAPELSLVFSLREGVKHRVPLREAEAIAQSADADALSPNVLLRPILERAILPTVAYAAGPAELTYFAQVGSVADALGTERPLAVPRWSCTIIEPHVQRVLDRLGIDYAELSDPHVVEGRLARAALPESVANALRRVQEAIDRATEELSTNANAAQLVPTRALISAKGAFFDRLQRLERRYVAAVKRREQALMRDVATARAHLYPDGKRQERALNLIPTLARQGPALWSAMRDAAALHARGLIGAFRS